ncbi:MAG: helix-turn-helix domain-containing protein [Solirubrobacteraceae bacterium]
MRDATQEQAKLGHALQSLRTTAGVTQEELAQTLGVHPTYVSQVERGKRGVRWYTVLRFLDGLGANLHQLADLMDVVEKQAKRPHKR